MKNLLTAILMTLVTTILLGLIYPLVVTGLAQVIFPDQANGSLIKRADGTVVGSRLIGQPFSSPGYFRSRSTPDRSPGARLRYQWLQQSGDQLRQVMRFLNRSFNLVL